MITPFWKRKIISSSRGISFWTFGLKGYKLGSISVWVNYSHLCYLKHNRQVREHTQEPQPGATSSKRKGFNKTKAINRNQCLELFGLRTSGHFSETEVCVQAVHFNLLDKCRYTGFHCLTLCLFRHLLCWPQPPHSTHHQVMTRLLCIFRHFFPFTNS